MRSGAVWSAGYQPTGAEPDEYSVDFQRGSRRSSRDATAALRRRSKCSSPPRTTPRSAGSRSPTPGARTRDIEITSYCELALGPQSADVAHPAFAKLFVETEYLVDIGAHPRHATQAHARRAGDLGRASQRRQRRGRGQAGVRDRPRALPRPRTGRRRADRDARRAAVDRTRSAPCSIPFSRCAAA